ncbi:lipid phosphate phosphatase 1 [Phlegmacium glaucopus]|nr:lipid phosphate phosphatase 1 [Phlegmacium glaucopus]
MSRLKDTIRRYFGRDALDWFHASYLTDWVVVGTIWLLSMLVSALPVYKRDFSISDPLISHPHKKSQVSSSLNYAIALLVPFTTIFVIWFRKSLFVIHHGTIGLCTALGLAQLVTRALKNSVGRLRPDFLATCKWEEIAAECTGTKEYILGGRQSFPSGHSSTAFSGMMFLSLWIAGQTAAWCFSLPKAPRNRYSSRMMVFLITLFPLFWASHVALTRLQDYRHHKEDVIVGSFIGILSAFLSYFIFWPNPFLTSSFDVSTYGQPRVLYTNENTPEFTEFHLTRTEEDGVNNVV